MNAQLQTQERFVSIKQMLPGRKYNVEGNAMNDLISSSDRRVLRTRRALRDALISLLVDKGWDDISIQVLCERADIGRSTFYLHFQNKEQLLVSGFDDLREFLLVQSAVESGKTTGAMPFVRGLIAHVYEQRILFKAIIGRRSGHVVQKRFRKMVSQLVENEIPLMTTGWQREAGTRYVAGALVELLAWWVDAGTERSADDIESLFYQLTLPVLKSLGKDK